MLVHSFQIHTSRLFNMQFNWSGLGSRHRSDDFSLEKGNSAIYASHVVESLHVTCRLPRVAAVYEAQQQWHGSKSITPCAID